MEQHTAIAFSADVIEHLKFYVYRLIDPRNGETFYVGKGRGNRVFAHIRGELEAGRDALSEKMRRIRDIREGNFEVAHVIHRHGMDDTTALEVEAALMDAYPGLTNEATGLASSSRGAMHALDVIREYAAEVAIFHHDAVLISVNRSAVSESSLYEATRYAWVISRSRAERCEIVLATVQGIIRGAFIADEWLEATAENFPGRHDAPGRYAFNGSEAPEAIRRLYVGKRIPDSCRRPGAANPIKYAQKEAAR